ncbi:hypothetical protein [Streptomyces sp. ICBB 8177]|nr:hypothetical protein [Streptomyces sp. ICBB 8177]
MDGKPLSDRPNAALATLYDGYQGTGTASHPASRIKVGFGCNGYRLS